MNLSQVELIIEIAKAGSISKAAKNLYLSQPSVSKALQRFEQEVNAQIFERVSTGVRLTPVGRRFVQNAQDIVDQLEKLEGIFDTQTTPLYIDLGIVSMSYHFMQFLIPELYKKYKHNPITIRYSECSFEEEMQQIVKGDAEIGILSFSQEELKMIIKKTRINGLEYNRLGNMDAYIAVSKNSVNYPAHVEHVDFDRLSRMPIVSISPSSPAGLTGWDFVRQLFGGRIHTSNQEIRTTSTGTMKEVVCQSDGFTLVLMNRGIYERFGFFDELRLIPIQQTTARFEMGWLQRANAVRSHLADEFIGALRDYVVID